MSKVDVKVIGGLGSGKHTAIEYDNEATLSLVEHKISKICSSFNSLDDIYAVYIVGMGGQPKDTYKKIEFFQGIEVRWTASTLPGLFKLASFVIASHSGLIRVKSSKHVNQVFLSLINQSMAGIYVFPAEYAKDFEDNVTQNHTHFEFDYGIKMFEDYFFYIVDADNYESSTGIYEIVSIGKNASYISDVF